MLAACLGLVAQPRLANRLTWWFGAGLGRMRARLDEAKECDTVGGEVGLGRVGATVSRCAGAYRKEALGRDGLVATWDWNGPEGPRSERGRGHVSRRLLGWKEMERSGAANPASDESAIRGHRLHVVRVSPRPPRLSLVIYQQRRAGV